MPTDKTYKKRPSQLRTRAERRVAEGKRRTIAGKGAVDLPRVLHELEVHQAELEIQNEELRTSRAEAEAALARFTELFEFAPIGYATLSSDGVIRELNHAGARVLGQVRSRLVGKPFAAFVAPGGRDAFLALLHLAAESDVPPSIELALATGVKAVQVRLTATAVARTERTILLAFEDVTERQVREERLARTELALREADRRKDDFLAMLSHELRNPLAPIRNSLNVLDSVEPTSPYALKARAIIERQVVHLTRLIEDLLDVTRITRGKVELHREEVELVELVGRTVDDHRASFEARGIGLEVRLAPGSLWLRADPARLIQIVSNVLSNAEKFTPAGGVVTVSAEARGGAVALRVRDTGVGIAPELIDGVFEPFAQAPQSMDRSRGGLGLGLAMVKGLTELHGGTVEISSGGAGHGTEVIVRLPLAEAPARRLDDAAAESKAPGRRVLVIEDNIDAAAALEAALGLLGHEVQVAHTGAAGLELARTLQPAIVFCDIGLPEMDGYAVAAAFRADPALREIYLVALSGYARPEDRRRALAAGFDDHVAKPPDLSELGRLIAEAPGSSVSARGLAARVAPGRAAAARGGIQPGAGRSPLSRPSSGPRRPARRGSAGD